MWNLYQSFHLTVNNPTSVFLRVKLFLKSDSLTIYQPIKTWCNICLFLPLKPDVMHTSHLFQDMSSRLIFSCKSLVFILTLSQWLGWEIQSLVNIENLVFKHCLDLNGLILSLFWYTVPGIVSYISSINNVVTCTK